MIRARLAFRTTSPVLRHSTPTLVASATRLRRPPRRALPMELASRVAASLRQQALTSSTHRPATRPASLTVAPRARVAMQIRSIEPSGAQDSYHANPPLADLRLQRAELSPGADAEVKCRYIGPAGIS